MSQQFLQQGILPTQFYDTSFSDLQMSLKAKSRKERVQDPMELIKKLGIS
ncbi:hypothetical protein [Liquorilactobacillus mali]|nr:hypothetical protein [Liquorilactobacillus mali]